jgi:hypothetical protein
VLLFGFEFAFRQDSLLHCAVFGVFTQHILSHEISDIFLDNSCCGAALHRGAEGSHIWERRGRRKRKRRKSREEEQGDQNKDEFGKETERAKFRALNKCAFGEIFIFIFFCASI